MYIASYWLGWSSGWVRGIVIEREFLCSISLVNGLLSWSNSISSLLLVNAWVLMPLLKGLIGVTDRRGNPLRESSGSAVCIALNAPLMNGDVSFVSLFSFLSMVSYFLRKKLCFCLLWCSADNCWLCMGVTTKVCVSRDSLLFLLLMILLSFPFLLLPRWMGCLIFMFFMGWYFCKFIIPDES